MLNIEWPIARQSSITIFLRHPVYIYDLKNIKNSGLNRDQICHESNLLVLNRVCATCRNVFSIFLERSTRFLILTSLVKA